MSPMWRMTWFSNRTPLPPSRSRASPIAQRADYAIGHVVPARPLSLTRGPAPARVRPSGRSSNRSATWRASPSSCARYLRSTVCGTQRQARREPASDTAASSPRRHSRRGCRLSAGSSSYNPAKGCPSLGERRAGRPERRSTCSSPISRRPFAPPSGYDQRCRDSINPPLSAAASKCCFRGEPAARRPTKAAARRPRAVRIAHHPGNAAVRRARQDS